ncbi:hypothetical protein KLEPA_00061 (plasmid) [Klebsiella pneumoniae]
MIVGPQSVIPGDAERAAGVALEWESGVRVIDYLRFSSGRLYLLLIYPKNAKDDLSENEKAAMRALTQQLK